MKKLAFTIYILAIGTIALAQDGFVKNRNRANELLKQHLWQEARTAFEEAERDFGTRRSDIITLDFYQKMGECYRQLGDYNNALRCYQQLEERLTGKKMSGPQEEERNALVATKMSEILMAMQQYPTVVRNLQKVRSDNPYVESQRVVNLASALFLTGEKERGLAMLDSTRLAHATERDAIFLACSNNYAWMLNSEGKHREAIEEYRTLLPAFTDGKERSICLGNLAIAEARVGDEKALSHIDEALSYMKQHYGEQHPDCIILMRKRAEVLFALQRRKEATTAFKTYFEHERQFIVDNFAYMTERERRNYWKMQQPLLAECFATEDVDPDFLFNVAIFSKSVLLQANRDFLSETSADSVLQKNYQQLRQLKYQIRLADATSRQSLQRQAEQLERQMVKQVTTMRQFNDNLLVNSQQVMASLENKKDAVVEFVRYNLCDTVRYGTIVAQQGKPTRFIALFSQDELYHYPIMGNARLKGELLPAIQHANNVQQNIKNKNNIYSDTALYAKIWNPILRHIPRGGTVYFSPEGIFHLLAIEYLYTEKPTHDFFRLSSARALYDHRQSSAASSRKKTLLVGGVNYKDTTHVHSYNTPLPDRDGSRIMSQDQVLPDEHSGFGYLNGSLTEADNLHHIMPTGTCQMFTYGEATEELLKQEMQNYSVVNISTHGYSLAIAEPDNTQLQKDSLREDLSLLRCGIVLAGADHTAQQRQENQFYEDGLLTASEISELNLTGVDLVVLSACQTALGLVSEDGLTGLPQGLKKAGVKTIMASLWTVDDEGTLLLMSSFYKHLNKCKSRREALKRAQNELRKRNDKKITFYKSVFDPATMTTRKVKQTVQKTFDDPYYWAPFIIIDGF
ncbi:MAG: CHAT domain-containing protein [Prevotella sp.]|nr:CHAT domain-containing protein [Prevotella sp.]